MTATAIEQVFLECSVENWDGHGAAPVDRRCFEQALRLVRMLPPGTPQAEVVAEPDGEIALEWHKSAERFLILSVGRDRELTCTWRDGAERACGVLRFEEEVPAEILECLGRILR